MLAELSRTMATCNGRTEKTGSPNAKMRSTRSKSWRKNIGGSRIILQRRSVDRVEKSLRNRRLEKTMRRGRPLIKYANNKSGKSKKV